MPTSAPPTVSTTSTEKITSTATPTISTSDHERINYTTADVVQSGHSSVTGMYVTFV